ncbi:hypothetical protein AB4Y45_32590 [Paraburkholderia sp. EG287A]|uniref:hypothetical protein n=1 Tax=Paraburkholderia sp. EG287A TaxID=3237012 RepID=UPI0034D368F6
MFKPIIASLALFAAGMTVAAAAQPTALTLREALEGISPVAYEAVQHLEAAHHTQYTDAQLNDLFTTPEFAAEYKRTHDAFCAKPENEKVLGCQSGQSVNAAAPRS